MRKNKDWLVFAKIAVLKTHLKWGTLTVLLEYKKLVFHISINNLFEKFI